MLKNALIVALIVGTFGFLLLVGFAVRQLYAEYGAGMMLAGVACIVTFSIPLGFLVDMRRSRVKQLLERIERRHGVDLTAEKSEAAEI